MPFFETLWGHDFEDLSNSLRIIFLFEVLYMIKISVKCIFNICDIFVKV